MGTPKEVPLIWERHKALGPTVVFYVFPIVRKQARTVFRVVAGPSNNGSPLTMLAINLTQSKYRLHVVDTGPILGTGVMN